MMKYLALFLCLALPVAAQEFTTLKGHGGPIMDIAVAPDGTVITASFDNSVGVWRDGVPTWLEGHEAAVVSVSFSPAGIPISGGDDFRLILWSPGLYDYIELTKHKGKVSAIAQHPGSRRLASSSWDGSIHHITTVTIKDTETGLSFPKRSVTSLQGHRAAVTDVAFAPKGTLYSVSSAGELFVWEGEGQALIPRKLLAHGFGINELIATESWLAYGAVDGGTRIVTPEGQEIADFTLDRRPILSMAYHAPTHQLAVGDGHGYIMMIDTAEWRITRDYRATRNGPVWALAFSNDGQTIWAGGLDDVVYGWPVASLDEFDPAISGERSFLADADSMPNGERQFMRKCSICHALEPGPSRKAGPTLHGVFGRRAGTLPGYRYSQTLDGSDIIWDETTIDALFDEGPDHYIPGSKMPMQVIAQAQDRADLITYLKENTKE